MGVLIVHSLNSPGLLYGGGLEYGAHWVLFSSFLFDDSGKMTLLYIGLS